MLTGTFNQLIDVLDPDRVQADHPPGGPVHLPVSVRMGSSTARIARVVARVVALLVTAGPVGPAFAGAPATTEAEEGLLRAHDVVIHELPTRSDGAVRLEALVDIQAPQAAVWSALTDFKGRLGGNKALKAVEPYRAPTDDEQWIRWTVASFGFEVVYHNHYVLDADDGSLTYALDRSQQNDLVSSQGAFAIYGSPAGAPFCRLVYEAESDFGHAIPGMVQRWMSNAAAKDFMLDLARRAEAAPR
jgi:hypothetical protein